MSRKTLAVHLFSIALASALLMGALPMTSHMSSMRMDREMVSERAVSETNIVSGNMNATSSESCCDVICPFSIFLVPQFAYAATCGDKKQVVNSDPLIQSIYIESAVPPPKA
jgi:hypothetical protein